MMNEEKIKRLEELKEMALDAKKYQEAVMNVALDAITEDLENTTIEEPIIPINEEKKEKLITSKIRVEFWQQFSGYDFINPPRIGKCATLRSNSKRIKDCLCLSGVPYKLKTETERMLLDGVYRIPINDGCYYEFGMMEKQKAVNYMKENNIPLTIRLYKDVLNLMLYDVITIEEKEKSR